MGSTFDIGQIVTLVTTLVTAIVGWMGKFLDFIVANPMVLLLFGLSLVGIGFRYLRKMFRMFG